MGQSGNANLIMNKQVLTIHEFRLKRRKRGGGRERERSVTTLDCSLLRFSFITRCSEILAENYEFLCIL